MYKYSEKAEHPEKSLQEGSQTPQNQNLTAQERRDLPWAGNQKSIKNQLYMRTSEGRSTQDAQASHLAYNTRKVIPT